MTGPPRARLGVIGGSGLYRIDGLQQVETHDVATPFGAPSSPLVIGTIAATRVAFIARHGEGHRLLPTEINYRANVYALKACGVEFVLSASAVGSLAAAIEPLHMVVPDQFLDRTRHRADTFFGEGIAAHVSVADPVCGELAARVAAAAEGSGTMVHRGGTYICMEGPQFSTRAESNFYRSIGGRVIGMTNIQEARLCREAELCFATLALVTDYDCWKTDEAPVTVEQIVDRLVTNAARARRVVDRVAAALPERRACACATSLEHAIITDRARIPPAAIERLRPIVARVLGA